MVLWLNSSPVEVIVFLLASLRFHHKIKDAMFLLSLGRLRLGGPCTTPINF